MKQHIGITITLVSLAVAIVLLGVGYTLAFNNVSNQKISYKSEQLRPFTKLDYDSVGNLEVVQSDNASYSLSGNDFYINNLVIEQKGDTLKVTSKETIPQIFNLDFLGAYNKSKMVLNVQDLTNIDIDGTGNFSLKNFTTDNMSLEFDGVGNNDLKNLSIRKLDIKADGTGNLNLKGIFKNQSFKLIKDGTGNLDLKDIDNNSIDINSNGTGNLTVAGKTQSMNLNINGIGNFAGQKLIANKAVIINSGTGNVTVSVIDDLNFTNAGIGNLAYYGDPRLHIENNGVGNIKSKGAIVND